MHGKWWHTDNTREDESYLTHRIVLTNCDGARFLISPDWKQSTAAKIMDQWFAGMTSRWMSMHLRNLANATVAQCSIEAAGFFIDAVMNEVEKWAVKPEAVDYWEHVPWGAGDKAHILGLLLALRSKELLAFPAGNWKWGKTSMRDRLTGPAGVIMDEWTAHVTTGQRLGSVIGSAFRVVAARLKLRTVGDLTPSVVGSDILARRKYAVAAARCLLLAQVQRHGHLVKHRIDDYGPFGRGAPRGRDGSSFLWVSERDSRLLEWCDLAKAYLSSRSTAISHSRASLNSFFDYLIDNRDVPRAPELFLRSRKLVSSFSHKSPGMHNGVFDFIEWVIQTRFSIESSDGLPARMTGIVNPIKRVPFAPTHSESVRDPMPTRYVRMALEILTEDDWAWAKMVGKSPRGHGDWINWWNAETKSFEAIWCPVRAVALYIKLRMPFRTHQVRFLDSGEADTKEFEYKSGSMVPNSGCLREGSREEPVQRGVLQAVYDKKADRLCTILRINTNKTADIGKEGCPEGGKRVGTVSGSPIRPQSLCGACRRRSLDGQARPASVGDDGRVEELLRQAKGACRGNRA